MTDLPPGYYFKSVGKLNLAILLICITFYSFTIAFPYYWLKWWTDAGGKLTFYWAGTYVAFAVAALMFMIGTFS